MVVLSARSHRQAYRHRDRLTPLERYLAEAFFYYQADFDPSKYRDEYREELLALIEQKARGEEIVAPVSEEPKPTKAPDLMAVLEPHEERVAS